MKSNLPRFMINIGFDFLLLFELFGCSGDGYRCTGNMTEWTKCMYITMTPARKAFKIPEEYHDVEFL